MLRTEMSRFRVVPHSCLLTINITLVMPEKRTEDKIEIQSSCGSKAGSWSEVDSIGSSLIEVWKLTKQGFF